MNITINNDLDRSTKLINFFDKIANRTNNKATIR